MAPILGLRLESMKAEAAAEVENEEPNSQPKHAPTSPELFGEIASSNSDYETAVKTNSRPFEPDETIPKTEIRIVWCVQ